jgi:hypothetical protein
METTYPFSTDWTHFFISNTHEHEQLLNFCFHGVHYLEYSMDRFNNGELYTLSSLSNLTQHLTIVAKSLTSFLGYLTWQRSPVSNPNLGHLQYIRNTWLREAISNLKICCHRYCLVALEIVRAVERRDANPGYEEKGLDIGDIGVAHSSVDGFDAHTNTPSWWTCMSAVSAHSSPSFDQSYQDSNEVI